MPARAAASLCGRPTSRRTARTLPASARSLLTPRLSTKSACPRMAATFHPYRRRTLATCSAASISCAVKRRCPPGVRCGEIRPLRSQMRRVCRLTPTASAASPTAYRRDVGVGSRHVVDVSLSCRTLDRVHLVTWHGEDPSDIPTRRTRSRSASSAARRRATLHRVRHRCRGEKGRAPRTGPTDTHLVGRLTEAERLTSRPAGTLNAIWPACVAPCRLVIRSLVVQNVGSLADSEGNGRTVNTRKCPCTGETGGGDRS